MLGKIQTISSSKDGSGNGSVFDVLPTIVNIFGQETYGRNGVYTNYDALKSAFELIAVMPLCKNNWYGSSVAMPFNIGCGFGGGDWNAVYNIMESTFKNVTLNLYKL